MTARPALDRWLAESEDLVRGGDGTDAMRCRPVTEDEAPSSPMAVLSDADLLSSAVESWAAFSQCMAELFDWVRDAADDLVGTLRASGLVPPDPSHHRSGDRWSGLGHRYRLVVTRQRGAHWKVVGPTRERWWK